MVDQIRKPAALVRTEFARYGRTYQLRIERAEDLRRVLDLDEALWVATGAPLAQLNVDPVLARQLDHNNSGRVLTDELKSAIRWTLEVLVDLEGVSRGSDVLELAAVSDSHEDGKKIRRSAERILARLEAPDRTRISLSQIRKVKAEVEERPVSEAGVVLAEAAERAEVAAFIAAVVGATGGVPHPCGKKGLDEATLDAFLEQARAHLDWLAEARGERESRSSILPLGDDTATAHQHLVAVRDKLDQYFAQCRAVAADPRVARHLLPAGDVLEAMDLSSPKVLADLLARAPLADPDPALFLEFNQVRHPRFAPLVETFREQVAERILGRSMDGMTEGEWSAVKGAFEAYETWLAARPSDVMAKVPADTLREYLEPGLAGAVRALIAESRETAFVLEDIRLAEVLVLLQANLLQIANNFVSFPHLYDPARRA